MCRIMADTGLRVSDVLALRIYQIRRTMYITEGKGFRCKATVVIGKPFQPDPKEKDYGVIADDILKRIYALKEQV